MFLSVCSPIFKSKIEPLADIVPDIYLPVRVVKYRHQEAEPSPSGVLQDAGFPPTLSNVPGLKTAGCATRPSRKLHGIVDMATIYSAGGHPQYALHFLRKSAHYRSSFRLRVIGHVPT
jgi:hypothetical protein